ncbi:MAG: glycosyltransferase family 4 protein [Planctomycetaceae bacterium]|nr:glycosyltransferase family 4 protein [Planctomycetaceae bacterium]
MRVLIVTQYFWPESFRINDLAACLKRRGHDVTVLTGLPNYPHGKLFAGYGYFSRRERYENVDVVRVPLLPRGKSKGLRLLANFVSFAVSASLLGPWLCRKAVDVIFVFEPSPITVALPAIVMKRLRRAPILFWVQDLWPETLAATKAVRSRRLLQLVDRFVRYVYRRCDRVLVQSQGFVEHVRAQGVASENVRYFPNSAESFYRPLARDEAKAEDAELPRGFRIVYAGNIGISQSIDTILDAAERTRDRPEIQWILLGEGRDRARVAEEIGRRRLERTVHLPGPRPVESMPRYFAAADALLATLRREPVFALTIPSKVQSYLACGRPILGSLDGEGARVVVEAEAGLVGAAEDGAALAANAGKLCDMPTRDRDRLGENGRRYFERHFDSTGLVDRLENWMAEVTEGRRCAA